MDNEFKKIMVQIIEIKYLQGQVQEVVLFQATQILIFTVKRTLQTSIFPYYKNMQGYQNSKQFFKNIPKEERSAYLTKVLEIPQKSGKYLPLRKNYPSQGKFDYKGFKLNYYFVASEPTPTAILLHYHGLNSHGGVSGYFGNRINSETGMHVYALDFKNFGMSQGDERGYIESFDELIEQADLFCDYVVGLYKQKVKIFLSGGSLGGSIIFKMAVRRPNKFSGLIFLSPALRQLAESMYIAKKFGKLIGFLLPKFKFMDQTYSSGTKYDMSEQIIADKCNYTEKVVPGSIRSVLNAMQEVSLQYKLLKTTYILFQSGTEKLVDLFAPLDLQEQCGVEDKTTIYFKDMWHNVFNEEQIQQISNITIQWLKTRK